MQIFSRESCFRVPFRGSNICFRLEIWKKNWGRGPKMFLPCVFFRPISENPKMKSCWLQGGEKKDDVGERERLLAGRRQRRDGERRERAPQEPRTCCC